MENISITIQNTSQSLDIVQSKPFELKHTQDKISQQTFQRVDSFCNDEHYKNMIEESKMSIEQLHNKYVLLHEEPAKEK